MIACIDFNCRFRYGTGFSLDMVFQSAGPITGLVGPSGSGKSTILSLIAGLLTPADGRIIIGDDEFSNSETRNVLPAHKRRIGYVFQDNRLFSHLNVKQNVYFGAKRFGVESRYVERVIEACEVADTLERDVSELSGGQTQRVALARAIACRPKLLLLDEPLNAVDDALRERISEMIRDIVSEFEIAVLLVTHHRPWIKSFANSIIEIANGRLVNH
ncbi:MAG: ATP-binding cassette domain-containing protein [Pirellulaceae bacterium]